MYACAEVHKTPYDVYINKRSEVINSHPRILPKHGSSKWARVHECLMCVYIV